MPLNPVIPLTGEFVFTLASLTLALPLGGVLSVVRAVEITPLPGSPSVILGVIDVRGTVVPVVDLRHRLGLKPKDPSPDDKMLLYRTPTRTVAVMADSIQGLHEPGSQAGLLPQSDLVFAAHWKGALTTPNGIILIYDMDQFLSLEEETVLDVALDGYVP